METEEEERRWEGGRVEGGGDEEVGGGEGGAKGQRREGIKGGEGGWDPINQTVIYEAKYYSPLKLRGHDRMNFLVALVLVTPYKGH